MIRSKEDLQREFDVYSTDDEVAALMEEIQRLDGRLETVLKGNGFTQEYAIYSPKNKHHETYKVVGSAAFEVDHAEKMVEHYLTTEGIHKDRQAAVVYRWVADWEYGEGYPKSHNEIERMREAKKGKERNGN